ncbi:hypothetical protein EMIT036CA2_20202 [Chryseobacterium sp. IT-36CA2]
MLATGVNTDTFAQNRENENIQSNRYIIYGGFSGMQSTKQNVRNKQGRN